MFLRHSVLRAVPTALLSVSLTFCASVSAKVVKTADYRPFTVISSKLGKEMPDSHIQDRLMCRSTMSALADNMDLLQNYDLLGSNRLDGTMSVTSFRGRQDGKIVQVMFWVETSTRQLNHLWVDGKPVFNCW
jgi:hypothetical protein